MFKPFSDGFIKLIRMVIAPIIFTTVVVGMAGMGNLKRIGRIGAKAFIYFEIMTTLALFIGWIVAKTVRPGEGMNVDVSTTQHQRSCKTNFRLRRSITVSWTCC